MLFPFPHLLRPKTFAFLLLAFCCLHFAFCFFLRCSLLSALGSSRFFAFCFWLLFFLNFFGILPFDLISLCAFCFLFFFAFLPFASFALLRFLAFALLRLLAACNMLLANHVCQHLIHWELITFMSRMGSHSCRLNDVTDTSRV